MVARGLAPCRSTGKRVLVLVPDGTRTFPGKLFFRLLIEHLQPRVKAVDFLVALGTHPPMSEAALLALVGITAEEKATTVQERAPPQPRLGQPRRAHPARHHPRRRDRARSPGAACARTCRCAINRLVLEYDHLLVCGPVFPHEVVGFSGGNKYFFPGIAGSDIINFTHWLGALDHLVPHHRRQGHAGARG